MTAKLRTLMISSLRKFCPNARNLFEFKPGSRWTHVQNESMSPKKASQQ
jgi:hypothetical protein